jgi:hypothetical protein
MSAEFWRLPTGREHSLQSGRKTVWRRTAVALIGSAAVVAGSVVAAVPAHADSATDPDFGPNVTILDPSMSADQINTTLAGLSTEGEFSTNRHAVLFKPGTYGSDAGQDDPSTATGIVNANVGYYETVAGLGQSPDDVHINGALHVEPVQGNAAAPWEAQDPGSLVNFWRSLSNVQINPIQRPVGDDASRQNPEGVADPHQMRWAVSQAAPLRRVDIQGSLTLYGEYGAFASGGFMADSRVSGQVVSGSQQQWYTQDSSLGSWNGAVWNQAFSGTTGAPASSWPTSQDEATTVLPFTNVAQTPVTRDAPFLTIGSDGSYSVFAPDARTNASGVSWTGTQAGRSIPITDFYIAHEGDSAETINAALAAGKDLLITPGEYSLDEPIDVTNPDTVVLGMGMATLSPTNGTAAIETGDTTGVQISGITIDAGAQQSPTLVQVGPSGAAQGDGSDPTTLTDVFVRVGGPHAGSTTTAIEVNSPHTLLDDIWAWRADHGTGVGWTTNTADHGLVVNGDDVTAEGLFVEHFQKEQVLWNGNGGDTIFYQSEMPYDPPSQADWMDGSSNGYPSYVVGSGVTSHTATALGVYSYFRDAVVSSATAISAPQNSGVSFTHMVTRYLNGNGGIDSVFDGQGGTADATVATQYLASS